MSVDIIMYKVNKLTGNDMNALRGQHFDNIDSLCDEEDWEYKAYSQDEIDKDPNRFVEILKYAKPIAMRRTVTNYRQCYIDNGMPEDIKSYGCRWHPDGVVLTFGDRSIHIDSETIDQYSHEEDCTYYIFKRMNIEADLSNWLARQIQEVLEKEYGYDLSYHPHYLTKKSADIICGELVKSYNEGDLYADEYTFGFIMQMMKALSNPEKRIFLEFQD